MVVAIVVPIFAGILVKGILAKLYAMINTMQLIYALSYVQVK